MTPAASDEGIKDTQLYDADAERDLVGAVLYEPRLFKRIKLKPIEFFTHRWRWCWEAYTDIDADGDNIDDASLRKYLEISGHWQDVNAREPLEDVYNPNTLHVDANARTIHDLWRRRVRLQELQAEANRVNNLDLPLPPEPGDFKTTWTGSELQKAEFPEPEGPIPGIIPIGLTVLGGRPKRGKSWLMLQAACALQTGGMFLDNQLQQCRVLYYALEDTPKRLQTRIHKLGFNPFPNVHFKTTIQPLELGGRAEIEQSIREGGYRVVILDTLRRAMPGRDFNKDGALFDEMLGNLQQIAIQKHVSVVVILHTRKASFGIDPDPVDDVLGSTGLTASADCVLALYAEQGKKGSALKGRGRDLDDIDLALYFDPLTCCWQSKGEGSELKDTELEANVVSVLEEFKKATIATISKNINKDFSNTRRKLISMWKEGKIKREETDGKTYYFLASNVQEV